MKYSRQTIQFLPFFSRPSPCSPNRIFREGRNHTTVVALGRKRVSSSNPRSIRSTRRSIHILLRKGSSSTEWPDCREKGLISFLIALNEWRVQRVPAVVSQDVVQYVDLPSFETAAATTFLLLHIDRLGLLLAVLHLVVPSFDQHLNGRKQRIMVTGWTALGKGSWVSSYWWTLAITLLRRTVVISLLWRTVSVGRESVSAVVDAVTSLRGPAPLAAARECSKCRCD
jgi:hypothetical protein